MRLPPVTTSIPARGWKARTKVASVCDRRDTSANSPEADPRLRAGSRQEASWAAVLLFQRTTRRSSRRWSGVIHRSVPLSLRWPTCRPARRRRSAPYGPSSPGFTRWPTFSRDQSLIIVPGAALALRGLSGGGSPAHAARDAGASSPGDDSRCARPCGARAHSQNRQKVPLTSHVLPPQCGVGEALLRGERRSRQARHLSHRRDA